MNTQTKVLATLSIAPARRVLIDPVIYAAQACLDFYQDDVDYEVVFTRYCEWVEV